MVEEKKGRISTLLNQVDWLTFLQSLSANYHVIFLIMPPLKQ